MSLRLSISLRDRLKAHTLSRTAKFLDPESVSITLVTSDAHKLGVSYKGRIRRITPRECARIQGYPDTFIHHPLDLHAYRLFGNSVSVPVVEAVVNDLFSNNNIAGMRSHYQKELATV